MAPKTSRTTKKVLMATGATHAPEVIERCYWPESHVAKDYFSAQVEKNKTEADILFVQSSDSSGSAIPRGHQTPFGDNEEGKGIMVEPRSILRMRVEKGKFCWSDIDFEAKSQTNPAFAQWAGDLMAKREYADRIISTGVGKALNLSKTLYINRSPADLEFLISR